MVQSGSRPFLIQKGHTRVGRGSVDFATSRVRPASEFEVESSLQNLSPRDFFVDLSRFSGLPSVLSRPATGRIEIGGKASFTLDRDFDAAIFLHKVHAPKLISR